MRVLVTRPAAQAEEWTAQLVSAGIDAVSMPLIAIVAPQDEAALRQAWTELASRQLIFFVSPNAVEWFFSARPPQMDWPAGLQAASPGPGTSAALRRCGVMPHSIVEPPADAPQFDSEALWQELQRQAWSHASVLVVRGDGGRDWLAEQLRSAGASVSFVSAYRRGAPQFSGAAEALLQSALAAPTQHIWFFSSSEAVANLMDLPQLKSSSVNVNMNWQMATALATHPRIAHSAQLAGFGKVYHCRPSLDAVVAALKPS